MGEANQWRKRIAWMVAALIRAVLRAALVSVVVALFAGIALFALRRAMPEFASLDPVKMYDDLREMKRDWPAFEAQLSESDREKYPELLAFVERTDTEVLVVVGFAFYMGLFIVALQIYIVILILLLFAWYLYDRLETADQAA